MVQGKSKATDIIWFTYTFIQAQKSLSVMTRKPSGIDGGHIFIHQNHCHAKHQNLFTRANTVLPSLGNSCIGPAWGASSPPFPGSVYSQLWPCFSQHHLPNLSGTYTRGEPLEAVELYLFMMIKLRLISKYYLWKEARVGNVFFPLVFTTPSFTYREQVLPL